MLHRIEKSRPLRDVAQSLSDGSMGKLGEDDDVKKLIQKVK